MESADERRRRKLSALCQRYGLRTVAERAKINPNTLDQVLKGVLLPPKQDGSRSPRALGDESVQKIEVAFGLPDGWFDAAEAVPLSKAALALGQFYDRLTDKDKMRFNRLVTLFFDLPPERVPATPDLGGISQIADLDDTGTG